MYALGEEGSCVGSDKVQTSTCFGKMRWVQLLFDMVQKFKQLIYHHKLCALRFF